MSKKFHTIRRYQSNIRSLLKSKPQRKFHSLALPSVGYKVTYKGYPILNEQETKETIGVGIKSLIGVFGGKKDEGYLKILQNRNKGLFTGEEKNDFLEIKENDKRDILTGIRYWMKRRYLQNKARDTFRSKFISYAHEDTSLIKRRPINFRSYIGKKLMSSRYEKNRPLDRLYNRVSAQYDTYFQELGVDNYSSQ